jgi:hypothetical protein
MTAVNTDDFWIGVAIVCCTIWTASTRWGSTYHAVTWLIVAAVFTLIRVLNRRRSRRNLLNALAQIETTDKTAPQHEDHRP